MSLTSMDDYIEDEEYEDDYWEPEAIECACGDVDYWCELCGYHGHTCPLEEE